MNLLNPSLIFLFLVTNLKAAQSQPEFFSKPGSKVIIEGTSTVHNWRVEGQVIDGSVKPGPGFPSSTTTQPLKDGKTIADIEGSIPVRSLHSVTEGKAMDVFVYSELKEDKNPRILFRFKELILKTLPQSENAPYLFDSQVEVVAAGVTNQLMMPVSLFVLANDNLRLVGSAPATFSSFGIAPSLQSISTTLRIYDEFKLNFEWLLSRKPK